MKTKNLLLLLLHLIKINFPTYHELFCVESVPRWHPLWPKIKMPRIKQASKKHKSLCLFSETTFSTVQSSSSLFVRDCANFSYLKIIFCSISKTTLGFLLDIEGGQRCQDSLSLYTMDDGICLTRLKNFLGTNFKSNQTLMLTQAIFCWESSSYFFRNKLNFFQYFFDSFIGILLTTRSLSSSTKPLQTLTLFFGHPKIFLLFISLYRASAAAAASVWPWPGPGQGIAA